MNKFLVFFLAFVFLFVSSFGLCCFADGSERVLDSGSDDVYLQSRSTVLVRAGEVYTLKSSLTLSSSTFIQNQLYFLTGDFVDSNFVLDVNVPVTRSLYFNKNGSFIYCYSFTGNWASSLPFEFATYNNGSLVSDDVNSAIQIVRDSYVDSGFLTFFDLAYTPSTTSIFSSVSDFFTGALALGSSLISFIADNWIAIIPLVLWVLIALFGVFRKLFIGV